MKTVAITTFASFAFAALSVAGDRHLSDLAKVQDAIEMVFVDEHSKPDGNFEWIPKGEPFKVGEAEKKVLKDLSRLKVGDQNVPLVGDLGVVAITVREGKVIALLGVYDLGTSFWIREATKQGKNYIAKDDGFSEEGESLEFARWMYAALTVRWPKEMAMREQEWRAESPGDKSIDEQIALLKNKSQQDGTGQPATRSQSKPEGSQKPQPEAEGRSR